MVFFRAQDEFDPQEPIKAVHPNAKHSPQAMKDHIVHNKKVNNPYISLTEEIHVAAAKYSYGHRMDKKGKYKFNEPRAKVLLIDLDGPMCEDADIANAPQSGKTSYYTWKKISQYFRPEDCYYSTADKETLVYSQIDPQYVCEIHPFLVDTLMMLSYYKSKGTYPGAEDAYNWIIEKIKDGTLSVDKVANMLKDVKVNKAENEFIEMFYNQRHSMETTFDKVFKDLPEKPSTREKLFFGTCLRVDIMKKLVPQLLEKEFPGKDFSYLSDYVLPIEEDIRMHNPNTKENKALAKYSDFVYIDASYEKKLPYGIDISYDDKGKIVGVIGSYKTAKQPEERRMMYSNAFDKGKAVIYPGISTDVLLQPILLKDSNYCGIDLIKNEHARLQREMEINSPNGKVQHNPETGEIWAFDQDGYCMKCEMVLKNGFSYFKVKDFVREEDGSRSKFSVLGFDVEGFNRQGINEKGLDRNGGDISGSNALGVPSVLDFAALKEKSVEEIEQILIDSMSKFEENRDKVNFPEEPIKRLLKEIIKTRLGNVGIIIKEREEQVGKKKVVKYELDTEEPSLKIESEESFYRDLYKKFFGKDLRNVGRDDIEAMDKLIKASLEVSKGYGIDFREMFTQEISKKREENDRIVAEAENALTQTDTKARKARKDLNAKVKNKKRQREVDDTKGRVAQSRFEDKFAKDEDDDGR